MLAGAGERREMDIENMRFHRPVLQVLEFELG
jgi:hypothetical protein